MLRPGGMLGPLVLAGRARDLLTLDDSTARVLGEASMSAEVDFLAGRKLVDIAVVPPEGAVAKLIGTPATTGFRAVLEAALPKDHATRSLRYLLLDDIPVVTLISGHALGYAAGAEGYGALHNSSHQKAWQANANLCAGWRKGGTILDEIETKGRPPVVVGPPAYELQSDDDPLAWHAHEPLPPHGMCRRRRLDLIKGDRLLVDGMFRDSHKPEDGEDMVVHEYTLKAEIDPDGLIIRAIEAKAQALPWQECPIAADSATRLVGRPVTDLRHYVRAELVGTTTCTHLNDMLRSLEDVVTLAQALNLPSLN